MILAVDDHQQCDTHDNTAAVPSQLIMIYRQPIDDHRMERLKFYYSHHAFKLNHFMPQKLSSPGHRIPIQTSPNEKYHSISPHAIDNARNTPRPAYAIA
ncbi:Uncharacterized protein HZ326_8119 [Fusarium oxysporum f. sp. albedinis]|nr:Uncharacterized protein HZ326_8119 [Fusarium oxysporum f. sp. albedinis]